MDTEMTTEKVLIKKEKHSSNIEQLIENDLSLADYYGDIVKILGSSSQTNIFSAVVTGDKAVIDGCVAIKLIYINSQGKTETVDCICPFNRSIDIKDASDSDKIDIECISEQISCRAINQRRAEVRGSVTLRVCITGIQECEFITDTPKDFCHTLKSTSEGNFLLGCTTKQFTLSTDSENSENYRNAKIYRIYAIPVVNETKTIKNKMMIRGNITANIILLTEAGAFAQERVTVPVNQIVDIDGIEEDCVCCVALKIRSVDARLTPDTPQAPPHAELALTVAADINAFKKETIQTIDEAYSSSHELICKNDSLKCVSSIQKINDNHTVTSKFDFSSCSVANICDAAVKRIKYTVHKDNESIVIKGNLHYGIIIETKENDKMYFERIADFEYKKQLNDINSEIETSPMIYLNALNCSVNSESSAVITAELHIDGFIFNYSNLNVITSIERGSEIKKDNSDSVITVYFASKGERLWDIAKQHNTSTDTIKDMNDLNTDTVENDCMLIFEQE